MYMDMLYTIDKNGLLVQKIIPLVRHMQAALPRFIWILENDHSIPGSFNNTLLHQKKML